MQNLKTSMHCIMTSYRNAGSFLDHHEFEENSFPVILSITLGEAVTRLGAYNLPRN